MLDIILFSIGLIGFSIAGYLDLRYTEFHDILPYSIIILTLVVKGVFSFLVSDFSIIINSIITGLIFLGIGFLLYITKQWGDGDAWLLGCFGFLFSTPTDILLSNFRSIIPFQISILFNFFIVSVIYVVLYSVILGIKTPGVYKNFISEMLNDGKKFYIYISISIIIFFLGASLFVFSVFLESFILFLVGFLLIGITLFTYYSRSLEKLAFKRKISVKDLREGDVLVENRWKGLTKKDIVKIRKDREWVYIKEGIRFAPVFIITQLVTFLYGGLLFL